LEDYLFIPANI